MLKNKPSYYADSSALNLKKLHQVLILWYILNLQAFLYFV